jgi:hypothetical protein
MAASPPGESEETTSAGRKYARSPERRCEQHPCAAPRGRRGRRCSGGHQGKSAQDQPRAHQDGERPLPSGPHAARPGVPWNLDDGRSNSYTPPHTKSVDERVNSIATDCKQPYWTALNELPQLLTTAHGRAGDEHSAAEVTKHLQTARRDNDNTRWGGEGELSSASMRSLTSSYVVDAVHSSVFHVTTSELSG